MRILRNICIGIIFLLPCYTALAIELDFPLNCKLGVNCWISDLQSHLLQKNKNKEVDFLCKSKTYPGNIGTAFATRRNDHMNNSVEVISPINGRVKSVKDGINDISINEIDRQSPVSDKCGNFVILVQDDFEIELCHLKKNSITVKVNDEVKVGQNIGQVGLSGATEYPHLHVNLRKIKANKKYVEVDPFYGEQKECGLTPKSLWTNPQQMEKQAAKTGIIYNYGFAFNEIVAEEVRLWQKNNVTQPPTPNSIIGFVDIFSVNAGDKISLKIVDEMGKELASKTKEFNQYQNRYFIYVSKPLNGQKLRGQYFLKIDYKHADNTTDTYKKSLLLD
jgi:hypothetical protein